jgi:metal-responsive CopG/Arc/MetJ family transcriptional regulator
MRKSTPKKRIGRPPTGRSPTATIALPRQLMDTVDKLAHEQKLSRSRIIQDLIAEALEARGKLKS